MPDTSLSDTWFPASGTPRGVVLLTHGLNGNPRSMDALAVQLAASSLEVYRVSFHGHRGNNKDFLHVKAKHWEDDAKKFHAEAWSRAQKLMVPLHHVAYSMSGLIFQTARDELKFDRRVYFAPALALKPWYPYAMFVAKMLPWFKFRSRIPRNYNANDISGSRSSLALHEFWKKWKPQSDNVPTLLWCNSGDELIDAEGLRKLAKTPWVYQELSTDGCTMEKRYHHLIIDENALGTREWERVVNETVRFLYSSSL